ncbi:unnamed protein product [Sphenostylis stenocarpa]|uniref:Uncharacterized protein n=1 Tax=Sphenostylis stenocarpa TaxID=92480 RepID=A0AA86VL89_9FABA|nr:unnamed protein product [Sphenostylis stenocarpa]
MNVDEGRNSNMVEEGWVMGCGLRRRAWVTTVAREKVENNGLVHGGSEGTTSVRVREKGLLPKKAMDEMESAEIKVTTGLWWLLVVRWTHYGGRRLGGGSRRGSRR